MQDSTFAGASLISCPHMNPLLWSRGIAQPSIHSSDKGKCSFYRKKTGPEDMRVVSPGFAERTYQAGNLITLTTTARWTNSTLFIKLHVVVIMIRGRKRKAEYFIFHHCEISCCDEKDKATHLTTRHPCKVKQVSTRPSSVTLSLFNKS